MTTLTIEPYEIPAADIGPENPLPVFRGPKEDVEVKTSENLPEEDRRHMGWRLGRRILPHRVQDGYTRDKRPRAFSAAVLENEFLIATILPELGGRMVSLFYKPDGRELLERNPVFQPANLALRNAWFSGGIEWNTSHNGHYYLTCSPVFAALVGGSEGEPVLRIYEWDRVKRFPWQIDFHLPPGSPFLFARMRIVNPHDYELPMYWWSNMAVPLKAGSRVVCPAHAAIGGGPDGFGLMEIPFVDGRDVSYPADAPYCNEFFFRVPEESRKWIAYLDDDGRGFVQTSTDLLKGRKMFFWGDSPGGRRWQEFLSVPGHAYLEIQAGLARTQLEHLPMPPGANWTWTEAYGFIEADREKVHAENWSAAWRSVQSVLDENLPAEQLAALDGSFAAVTGRPPEKILSRGEGWGALERRRLSEQAEQDRIPAELVFDGLGLGSEQEPWIALLTSGELPERDPKENPLQGMVQPAWRRLLEEALQSGRGNHWLSWLHLGNMRREALDFEGAREAWNRSLDHKRSGWALRNLADLARTEEKPEDAVELLDQAWEAGPKIAPIAIEYALMLLQLGRYQQVRDFMGSLPAEVQKNERLRLISAKAALETGHFDEVEEFFSQEFVTVREGEVALTDLWFALHERKIAQAEGVPMDDELRRRVRVEYPPPARIDFRAGKSAYNIS